MRYLWIVFFLGVPFPASAKKTIGDALPQLDTTAGKTGVEKTDVFTVSGVVIQAALLIVGTAFLILTVYGGFLWMTAHGNEDQVTKGRNTVIAALIGLALIVAAYAITNAVTSGLIG